VLAAVIAGAGVSVLPRYLAEPAMAAGSVEELHQPTIPPLNILYLATLVGGARNPSVALTHEHLVARAQSWGTL
jgi:DNA-binding transcriptional LysR family regulator